ncbi:MAG: flagellar hook-basal body complex protein FliE [Alphaproteobacteria bacterium]|jgi:flagellar hook-basal body complex protein FliE|nr:flagellar hook-basal body complex protein FliE [Alphaproteobacteria bacterium]
MKVPSASAAAAYAVRQVPTATAKIGDAGAAEIAGKGNFSNLVQSTLTQTVNATKAGETVSMQALTNPGDIGSVVTAVTNAEITMQTVVAVRDRVVQAYQDILRMPI